MTHIEAGVLLKLSSSLHTEISQIDPLCDLNRTPLSKLPRNARLYAIFRRIVDKLRCPHNSFAKIRIFKSFLHFLISRS